MAQIPPKKTRLTLHMCGPLCAFLSKAEHRLKHLSTRCQYLVCDYAEMDTLMNYFLGLACALNGLTSNG